MLYSWLADLVLVVHLAFVVFVVLGGLLVFGWPRVAWVHLPAALWGAWIELSMKICPLTPLENRLLVLAGDSGYSGGFLERYLLGVLYPTGLARSQHLGLAAALLLINVAIYGVFAWKRWGRRS